MSILKKPALGVAGALLFGATALGATALTAAPAHAAVPFHELVGQGSHKCLDVRAEDGVGNRNARVQTWQCFGSANQEWGIIFAGTYGGVDYFEFAGKTTGSLCMEVRDSSFSDGAQVDQFPCAPDANQLWRLGPGTGEQLVHAGLHEQREVPRCERQLDRQRREGPAVGLQRLDRAELHVQLIRRVNPPGAGPASGVVVVAQPGAGLAARIVPRFYGRTFWLSRRRRCQGRYRALQRPEPSRAARRRTTRTRSSPSSISEFT